MRRAGCRSCASRPSGSTTPKIAPQPASSTWFRDRSISPMIASARSITPKSGIQSASVNTSTLAPSAVEGRCRGSTAQAASVPASSRR